MSKKIKPTVRQTSEKTFIAVYIDENNKEYSFQAKSFGLAVSGWYKKFSKELGIGGG